MQGQRTVFVGLSGGVDSSVAALQVKNEGHNVVGAFIKIAQSDIPGCTSADDRVSAMRVAARLKIPFKEIDLSEAYRQKVIQHFIYKYKQGLTPNPDVFCNNEIKFKLFASWAFSEGADCIATGHYTQKCNSSNGVFLKRAKDLSKDQTYFLWGVRKSILAKVLFPIGHLLKEEVRTIARKNALHTSTRPDSQGLCFLGDVDVKEFLAKELKPQKGSVSTTDGNSVGTHPGSVLFTIGERHGFKVDDAHNNGKPYYITAINHHENLLIVSQTPPSTISGTKLVLADCNWFLEPNQILLSGQFRHLGSTTPVRIKKENGTYVCTVEKSTHSIACGQSAVFFKDDLCIGGGIVARIL